MTDLSCVVSVPSDVKSGRHVDIDLPRPACAGRSAVAVRKPKKRWPFQAVPVIAFATCERLE